MIIRFCLLLFCSVIFIPSASGAALHLPDSGEISLSNHWELLYDPENRLSPEQLGDPEWAARFQPQETLPSLGYVSGAAWLRITLIRPVRSSSSWWLELRSAILDDVTLFSPQDDGSYRTSTAGDRHPFMTRELRYRHPVFKLDLPAEKPVTVYLRIRSSSTMSFPMVLWTPDAFVASTATDLLLLGLLYAVHLVLIGTCLAFFHTEHRTSYVLFGFYVLAYMATSLAIEGFAHQYLFADAPTLNEVVAVTGWLASPPLGLAFMFHHLGLYTSRWRHWALGLTIFTAAFAAICAPLIILNLAPWLRPVNILWGCGLIALVTVIAALLSWEGNKSARVIVLVQSILLAGLLLRYARNVGAIAPGKITDNAYYLGLMAHMMVLYSAIQRRYEELRIEKDAARAEALQVARQAEKELEAKVASRTHALREAMAQVEAALSVERRAQEEQRQFLSTISHELRTPLSVIGATVQNLEIDHADADPSTRARYERILRATERLAVLLEDSLDEERFELLRYGIRMEPAELAPLLKDAAQAAGLLSNSHRLVTVADELPASFPCDAGLMRLVLRTLADNAVKYTPAGSEVILRGRAVRNGVVLEVEDNGPGIPEADLPYVLDRYYRGRNTASQPGTGLGLPLASRMMEMQGGTLKLENLPGQGCRITLFLPACRVPDPSGEVRPCDLHLTADVTSERSSPQSCSLHDAPS